MAPPSQIRTYVTSMRGARFQGGTVDTLAHELAEPIRPVKPSSVRSTTKTKIDWTHGTRPWQTVSLKGKNALPVALHHGGGELSHSGARTVCKLSGLVYSEMAIL